MSHRTLAVLLLGAILPTRSATVPLPPGARAGRAGLGPGHCMAYWQGTPRRAARKYVHGLYNTGTPCTQSVDWLIMCGSELQHHLLCTRREGKLRGSRVPRQQC